MPSVYGHVYFPGGQVLRFHEEFMGLYYLLPSEKAKFLGWGTAGDTHM